MFCTACGSPLPGGAKFCARCGAAVVEIPDRPLARVADPPRYAGFWPRAAAIMIDGIVLWVPNAFVMMGVIFTMVGFDGGGEPRAPDALFFVTLYGSMWAIQWLYFAWMHSSKWQATLGKQALGIKVTSLTGERITFWRASLRFLGGIVETFTFGVGLLMAAVTQRRQALHDFIGGTLVTSATTTPDDVRRGLHAEPVSRAVVALTLAAPLLFFCTVLALIAIPVYADYKMRQQVLADWDLAAKYRDQVAIELRAGSLLGEIDNARVDLPEKVDARYVASIEVQGGMVRLWFGETSHPALNGKVLTFTPAFDKAGELAWICGYAVPPQGVTPVDPEYQEFTTLPVTALPVECR